jgi:CTP-dependent riboflavin kinase
MKSITIVGELATGIGQATGFTQLDWAHEAFLNLLGINAYPGTVNILVREPEQAKNWNEVKSWPGIIIPPPRPDWCNSRCYHARIAGGIEAAIVLPEIDSYAADQIELIAAVNVRDALGASDGDRLSIDVRDTREAVHE